MEKADKPLYVVKEVYFYARYGRKVKNDVVDKEKEVQTGLSTAVGIRREIMDA